MESLYDESLSRVASMLSGDDLLKLGASSRLLDERVGAIWAARHREDSAAAVSRDLAERERRRFFLNRKMAALRHVRWVETPLHMRSPPCERHEGAVTMIFAGGDALLVFGR
jgi:hypothetical protein